MLNILKIDNDSNNIEKREVPSCIQDLMEHPTLTDPAYSIFTENLRRFKLAYFDGKCTKPNWKELCELDEWTYEAELIKL